MAKTRRCGWCDAEIKSKDVVGINLKLLGGSGTELYCMTCLAEYIGCTIDDLETKIEEFKEQGCTLFG